MIRKESLERERFLKEIEKTFNQRRKTSSKIQIVVGIRIIIYRKKWNRFNFDMPMGHKIKEKSEMILTINLKFNKS